MGAYAYSLQRNAFPNSGFSSGQIIVTVYVSVSPARVTLKSYVYLDPHGDTLSVNVTGPKGVNDPWLLVVQCPADTGLPSANHGVELYSEGSSGRQELGTVTVAHHNYKNWSGSLGCFKDSQMAEKTIEGQNIDATLPVLEQNPFAQSAQAETPVYVERSTSGKQQVSDLVEVSQPLDSFCPAAGQNSVLSRPSLVPPLITPGPAILRGDTPPATAPPNLYSAPPLVTGPCYTQVLPDTVASKYNIPTTVTTSETLEGVSLSNDRIDSMFPPGQISSDGKITWQGLSALSPSLSAANLSLAASASEDTFFAGVWYGLGAGFFVPFIQGLPDAIRKAVPGGASGEDRPAEVPAKALAGAPAEEQEAPAEEPEEQG